MSIERSASVLAKPVRRLALRTLHLAAAALLAVSATSVMAQGSALVAGEHHTCTLADGGGVKCWGLNGNGQLGNGSTTNSNTAVDVTGIIGATSLAAGFHHTCALIGDGTVRCWGENNSGQIGDGSTTQRSTPVAVSGLASATVLAAGHRHTCAVLADATVRCWGQNDYGQLGNGTTTYSTTPVVVSGLSNAAEVVAGYGHTCSRLSDATMKCWGRNGEGQLGNGTTTQNPLPVAVSGLSGVAEIVAGSVHTCALIDDDTVHCWGHNAYGQLGDGSTTNRLTPVAVPGLSGATELSGGAQALHTCVSINDGAVRCWGYNDSGQLGDGSLTMRLSPVTVAGLSFARTMATGYYHTCALINDGAVRCWGRNYEGQLGDGSVAQRNSPVVVSGLTSAVDVVAGMFHTCVRLADETARCWGGNNAGPVGDGSTIQRTTPVAVSGLASTSALTAGWEHSCALISDGTARCWGYGANGQLGDGSNVNRTSPVAVASVTNASGLATGANHTCTLMAGGAAKCWGYNGFGQLGNGTTTNSATAVSVSGLAGGTRIAAGGNHVCALINDGTARCWGYNALGQLGNGTTTQSGVPVVVSGLANATAVTAGSAHTCVLVGDGTVRCWGYNGYGQLGNGTTTLSATPVMVAGLSNAIAVSAGNTHTCALVSDGSVRCWGYNYSGQLGDGSTTNRTTPVAVSGLSNVAAIAAGNAHSCAVLGDGTARCWGDNTDGRLGNGEAMRATTPTNVVGSPFLPTYVLTYTAGPNGSIGGSGAQTVVHGSDAAAVTAVPDPGYHFVQWSDLSTANPRADTNVTANISVTASFAANAYTVSFDSQGGSAVSSITQDYASTVTVPAAPTRSGYTFANWNTAADGTGTAYAPAATFSMPAANSTLYAIWTINQYTVSFDSQGGSAVSSITQDFASTVTVPAAPTRSGYTFANWNAAADGTGTAYAPAATFSMPAANSTLYAIWTINQYTVSFDSQGGSAVSSITQDFASTVTVPVAPTRSGYTFANWNTAADGTGTAYAPAATFAMPANNSTLYAIWTINQYTVSFDSQGGSAVSSITQDYASTVTVPAAPTRAGYTFANWNTAADGTGTAYAPAATFSMPAANSTLYAIWTINQYTVSFDSQGGSAVSSITQDYASTVTVPAAPTRSGYTFANWNTAADGTGTAYAPAATFSMPAANSTLYAIWTINQYTVSFDSQGGSAVSSITQDFASTVTVPAAPTRSGYTFANWNAAADGTGTAYAPAATFSMPAANSTLYAIWTINQYTVSFDSQGGSAVSSITQDFASTVTVPVAPTRSGYTFANWNTAADGTGTAYAPAATFAMPANNSTLYAIWTINQYTVSFDSQGGSAVSSITQDYASTVTVPAAPTRAGYTFANWNTAADGTGTAYAPAATFSMPAANSTLYAIWTINQYTVSFDSQGGSAVSSITQDFATTVTVPGAPTRSGYTFANWNTLADGSGTAYAPAATFSMPAANSTLYAIWTINQYTVSFDSQGGSAVSSITQDFASTVTVPAAPTRSGYTFANWNAAADGTGTAYAPAATFSMPAANSTLYAIWTINQYTVSFDSQGGSAVSSITQDFASTVTVPAAPTRSGYTFANWNAAADGTGTAYAPAATFSMPAANSTLYAIWTINQYTVSFDSQGGSAVSSITQDFASTVTVPVAPTRSGYTFANWNAAADGTGTAYAPAATFSMPANNSTLYAQWSNTAPTLAVIGDVVLNEDGGATVLLDIGDTESLPAALSVVATSGQIALLPHPTVNTVANPGQRELVLTPVANGNGGPVTVTVTVNDEGGLSATRTFLVTVRPVNDAPTFATSGNRTEPAGASGLRTVPSFIQSLSVGPADESAQFILGYSVVQVSDPSGVVTAISVAVDGTLSYTLSGNGGSASFEIRGTDNGGSAYGGQPTSSPVAFTISVGSGADLQISKSNGRTTFMPGESVLYDLYVANAGPNDVVGARVQDSIPAELVGAAWTCTAILRATCPTAAGVDSIDALVDLRSGGVLRFSLLASVAPTTIDRMLINTATVTPPTGMAELSPSDNSDTDSDRILIDGLFLDGFEDGTNRITVPFVDPDR